jgi:hypothetical protein
VLLNICSVKFPEPPFNRNPAVVVFTTLPEMIWLGARTSRPVGPAYLLDFKLAFEWDDANLHHIARHQVSLEEASRSLKTIHSTLRPRPWTAKNAPRASAAQIEAGSSWW